MRADIFSPSSNFRYEVVQLPSRAHLMDRAALRQHDEAAGQDLGDQRPPAGRRPGQQQPCADNRKGVGHQKAERAIRRTPDVLCGQQALVRIWTVNFRLSLPSCRKTNTLSLEKKLPNPAVEGDLGLG